MTQAGKRPWMIVLEYGGPTAIVFLCFDKRFEAFMGSLEPMKLVSRLVSFATGGFINISANSIGWFAGMTALFMAFGYAHAMLIRHVARQELRSIKSARDKT
jgi:hypothetical protein